MKMATTHCDMPVCHPAFCTSKTSTATVVAAAVVAVAVAAASALAQHVIEVSQGLRSHCCIQCSCIVSHLRKVQNTSSSRNQSWLYRC